MVSTWFVNSRCWKLFTLSKAFERMNIWWLSIGHITVYMCGFLNKNRCLRVGDLLLLWLLWTQMMSFVCVQIFSWSKRKSIILIQMLQHSNIPCSLVEYPLRKSNTSINIYCLEDFFRGSWRDELFQSQLLARDASEHSMIISRLERSSKRSPKWRLR